MKEEGGREREGGREEEALLIRVLGWFMRERERERERERLGKWKRAILE